MMMMMMMKKAIYSCLAVAISVILMVTGVWSGDKEDKAKDRLVVLEAAVAALQSENTDQQIQVDALIVDLATALSDISTLQADLDALQPAAEFAMTLEPIVRVDPDPINGLTGPHVIFEGANVHVQSGSGSTDDYGGITIGLGNLIVGYNEEPVGTFNRFGSHNLVLGPNHIYSSFGGLIAGKYNTTSGPHASVTGGDGNEASGEYASVSGGSGNLASGFRASISGGAANVASAGAPAGPGVGIAWVGGGFGNEASGNASSVSGGAGNVASGASSSVSGGGGNEASGNHSSVSGGWTRLANDDYNWAAGLLYQDW